MSNGPEPLASLPPSPETVSVRLDKGKGRQYENYEEGEAYSEEDYSEGGNYPPGHDEYEETQRVEQTLKRWEVAERQRRKTARESAQVALNNHLWNPRPNPKHKPIPSTDSDAVDAVPLNPITPNPFIHPSESESEPKVPPPKPLGLPPPKAAPPPSALAYPHGGDDDDDEDQVNVQPTRWWHEWLCGCGEGPDRGGEQQAGRTNPSE